jgi:hypothetical protein
VILIPISTCPNEKNEIHVTDTTSKYEVFHKTATNDRLRLRPENLEMNKKGKTTGTMIIKQTWTFLPTDSSDSNRYDNWISHTERSSHRNCLSRQNFRRDQHRDRSIHMHIRRPSDHLGYDSAQGDVDSHHLWTRVEGIHIVEKSKETAGHDSLDLI